MAKKHGPVRLGRWLIPGVMAFALPAVAQEATPAADPAPTAAPEKPDPTPATPAPDAAPAAATADAEAPDAGDNGALVIAPSSTFGLLVEDAFGGQPDQTVGAGLSVGWHYGDMVVQLEGEWQMHERTYLAEGAGPDGGAPLARVEEHSAYGAATFHYDFANLAGVDFRDFAFGPYGGLLGRQLINDIYPSLLAGVLVGAEVGIDVGRGLRFDAGVDYTHHIGRFFLDEALGETASRHGKQLGWLRWRGAFGLFQDELTALSLGYQGSWLALEHTNTYDHTAKLELSLALPL